MCVCVICSWQAVLSVIQQKFQTRKFDQGDRTFLRALMRRYGWERRTSATTACPWFQTFSEVRKAEDWSEIAWFLATELLHPLASIGMRDLHNPIAVSEARSSEQGIDRVAVSLRDDLLAWQELEKCCRLPSVQENQDLARRVERYYTDHATKRAEAMRKAYPPDFDPLSALALDCLGSGPDAEHGLLWRSAAERALLFAIPGWCEGRRNKQCFLPVEDMLKLSDKVVREALKVLRDPEASLTRKLEKVAAWLDCSPSLPGVCEAVSCRLLCPCSDDPSVISERYCCRLCAFSCQNLGDLKQHIVSSHCVRPLDAELAFVEYRKKILAMVEHAGPMASWRM